jgi:hypothetical protein
MSVPKSATNNPRQIRAKGCGCKLCVAKYRPDTKPTRKDCTGPWQARYRDPAGNQKAKNFPTKKLAEAFLDTVRTTVRDRTYIDPVEAPSPCLPGMRSGSTPTAARPRRSSATRRHGGSM